MEHIIDRLIADIKTKNSVVCVGLDPVNEPVEKIFEFNKKIIDSTFDLVVAFKTQIAYYELHGAEGLEILKKTIQYIRSKGVVAIDDSKRGDIGPTAKAYATGHFEGLGADMITLNPYMGTDSIAPFLEYSSKGHGSFILCRTSNSSAGEMQDLVMQNNEPLYTNVANMIANWGANSIGENGYSAVGAVVGATYPEEAKKMRALMPKNFWLVPGYGAQGGNAESVKHCFNADGLGAIINSSRGIIYDPDPRQAVVKMRDELNAIRMNLTN